MTGHKNVIAKRSEAISIVEDGNSIVVHTECLRKPIAGDCAVHCSTYLLLGLHALVAAPAHHPAVGSL
jgi:hypothetical protein